MSQKIRKKNEEKNTTNNYTIFGGTPYKKQHSEEEYMCKSQRDYFRNLLKEWQAQIIQEAEKTLREMQEETSDVLPDPGDQATREESLRQRLRARAREGNLLKKIDEALSQIDKQEYGYCEACGIEIGLSRLEARPTATLCFDCKTLAELQEKRNQQ